MEDNIHQPHDKLFKKAMSDIRVAREFFEHHLPQFIKEQIDFETLVLCKETFINKKLRALAADVIYQAKLKSSGVIYLPVEQQTKPERWLLKRAMEYKFEITVSHQAQNPNDQYLPVVYLTIFYTGAMPYQFSTDMYDLYGERLMLWLRDLEVQQGYDYAQVLMYYFF